jgi:hypothetical protein
MVPTVMMRTTCTKLAESIRNTLRQVEQRSGVAPTDPALVALKAILARRLGEIKNSRNGRPPIPDWTSGRRRCFF